MNDESLFTLQMLRSALGEHRNLHGDALRGRAYARQKISTLIQLFENPDMLILGDASPLVPLLQAWINAMGDVDEFGEFLYNDQAQYALECARVFFNHAQLVSDKRHPAYSVYSNIGIALSQLAKWLTLYPIEGDAE